MFYTAVITAALSCAMQDPASPTTDRPSNHLAGQTSPYLLQHVHNPVDWYPWDSEALERAKAEGKPIFLSIGYSACHWCHVMEHESFENEEVAAYLNEHFISIKVDREERPDLDDLYMSAVQRMTGQGGWPMTVFLTPDLKPFFGGTYFPLESKYGRPGFKELLHNIHDAWLNRREAVLQSADQFTDMLEVEFPHVEAMELPSPEEVRTLEKQWVKEFVERFDSDWGGFGEAPKFPPSGALLWLLEVAAQYPSNQELRAAHLPNVKEKSAKAYSAEEMAFLTLWKMSTGGMYDQIGGGFARYSVDEKWLIPHFEKMLYDQGTLIPAYLAGSRVVGGERMTQIAAECCDYLLRERIDPAGGIWSATDADSEGEEGKFFAWTPQQLIDVLGEERGKFAAEYFDVTEAGTFEHGTSVLQSRQDLATVAVKHGYVLSDSPPLKQIREELYQARAKRIAPGNDDKVLAAWNGLAIHALAFAGAGLNEPRYQKAAEQAADFVWEQMRKDDVLYRSWRQGKAQHRAVLEDYSYLTRALLTLFQTSGNEKWLQRAEHLGEQMLAKFWDEETAIFWDTDGEDATVLHRLKSPWDGAIPSPNAIALEALLGLYAFTHDQKWQQPAMNGLAAMLPHVKRSPSAFCYTLRLYRLAADEPTVAVVIGGNNDEDLTAWRQALLRRRTPLADWFVLRPSAAADSELALFRGRKAVDGKATLYLCQGATCQAPTTQLPQE